MSITAATGPLAREDLSPLFQPMSVGPLTVSNRMMMAGMSAGVRADADGGVDPQMAAYIMERARGGPGLIAIGASQVVPHNHRTSHQFELFNDDFIPSMAKLAASVREYDSLLGIQLWNGGGTEGTSAEGLISPSGLSANVRTALGDATSRRRDQSNRAMTVEEIKAAIPSLTLEERAEIIAELSAWTDDDWDRQMTSDAAAGKFTGRACHHRVCHQLRRKG